MFIYACKPDEQIVIERHGQYHKTVTEPGWHLKGPFDRVAKRYTTHDFQKPIGLQFKSKDGIGIYLDISARMRVGNAQLYHGTADPVTQADYALRAAILPEVSGMEYADMKRIDVALERATAPLLQKLRDDYGIDLVSVEQQALHVPDGEKQLKALQAATEEKARDVAASSNAMKEGLTSNVRVGKPLVLKKPVA